MENIEIKSKCEKILGKELFIKCGNIITDSDNTFEIICNENGSFDINEIHFNNDSDFFEMFSKLNKEINQDERYKAYVNLLGYSEDLLDFYGKITLIENSKYLDLLIYDEDISIRCYIVEKGYGLDELINDKDEKVRMTVAKQGYGLDKLINDESSLVRIAVAEQGYGLDKLVNDKNNFVREAVAKQGYGLDILVNDDFHNVREAALAKKVMINRLK